MRTARTLLVLAGLVLTGCGLYGIATDHYIDLVHHPFDILRWAIAGLLLHDGLWLPLLCLCGITIARTTPVRTGLIVAAAVSAVALPAVLRADHHNGNPTILPLPYLRNWLLTLAAIALVTAIWTVLSRHRRSRSRR
ncbi:hypothetical protein P3T36_001226 [Kitasatospora sp. MAP12-15]|uniref:hypothetical protein n=1 Tax=unclassified Kitasatospora TaxID=2633591 RepID=UPI0024745975|nr:hypothetical protein [Kitasatospora sp. MAP12-44]MDH6114876.1 hypothetical protein [Kitasatospora sp. MAP12-44]